MNKMEENPRATRDVEPNLFVCCSAETIFPRQEMMGARACVPGNLFLVTVSTDLHWHQSSSKTTELIAVRFPCRRRRPCRVLIASVALSSLAPRCCSGKISQQQQRLYRIARSSSTSAVAANDARHVGGASGPRYAQHSAPYRPDASRLDQLWPICIRRRQLEKEKRKEKFRLMTPRLFFFFVEIATAVIIALDCRAFNRPPLERMRSGRVVISTPGADVPGSSFLPGCRNIVVVKASRVRHLSFIGASIPSADPSIRRGAPKRFFYLLLMLWWT